VISALVTSLVQLHLRGQLNLDNFLSQFNSFPFYIVLAIFAGCNFLARILNSAFVTFVLGYCLHRSHRRESLHELAQVNQADRVERGYTTATPRTPDLNQLPFRHERS
jgi:hypothetical protein